MSFWADLRACYGKAYNDGAATLPDGGYRGSGHWDRVGRWRSSACGIAALMEDWARTVGRQAPLRVLELGCGRGVMVRELRGLGLNAVGLDISVEAPAPCCATGNAVALPTHATFDAVVALDVLEHVPADWQAQLWGELRRVLSGGLLVATVPATVARGRADTSEAGLRNHYLEGPPEWWGARFREHGFETLATGNELARWGMPFAFGPENHPFVLASVSRAWSWVPPLDPGAAVASYDLRRRRVMRVWFPGKRAQYAPRFKMRLDPGENEVPEDLGERMIASGLVERVAPVVDLEPKPDATAGGEGTPPDIAPAASKKRKKRGDR